MSTAHRPAPLARFVSLLMLITAVGCEVSGGSSADAESDTATGTDTDTVADTDAAGDTATALDTGTLSDTVSALPSLTLQNVVCPEGNVGTSVCKLPLRLTSAGTQPAVFHVTVNATGTSATAGTDFTFTGGEFSIPAGATATDLDLILLGDTMFEPDETVAFSLEIVSGAVPATVNGTGGIATIANDDSAAPAVTIAIENRLCPEGNVGNSACAVTVRLSAPSAAPVTFRVSPNPAASTATQGVDYVYATANYSIPAGATTTTVELTVVGDLTVELDEVVALTLDEVVGATPATINGTGALITLVNDDAAPLPSPTTLASPIFQQSATTLPDGRIFVAGGHNGATELATTWLIAANGSAVTPGPGLPTPRARHSATLLADGRVLLTGGLTAGSVVALASTVLCDLSANICTAGPSLSAGRLLHAAVLLTDGRVLLAGGVPNYGTAGNLASAELFVPAGGGQPDHLVAAENAMPTPRDSMAAARFASGEVVLAGGAGVGTGIELVRYRPGVGFALDASQLQVPHINATATLMPDGRVLVVGGYMQATTEWLALSSDLTAPLGVSAGPTLAEARYHHVALLLVGGGLLVSGGYDWVIATSSLVARSTVEVLGPSAAAWVSASPLSVGRGEHAAAVLPLVGLVAHIGGSNGSVPTATMDLLAP